MKIFSVITATLVLVVLYFVVFERARLLSFAGNESATETVAPATADPATAAKDAPTSGDTNAHVVPVVARHSTATALDSAVIVRGETEAAREVSVMSEATGRMEIEPLRKGAQVSAGDVLCRLDAGTSQATLVQAQAAVSEAELGLNNATRLSQGGYASETQILSAQAALESARASLAAAQNGVERLEIRAPFAGILETDAAELGALLQPGSVCATIIQLDPVKLVGFVPEAEVSRVSVGAMAGARLISGREVGGKVTFLSRAADPQTRTFRTEINVPNPDLAIRDGQTVEITIASEGTTAHLVAQSTLTLDDSGTIGVRTVATAEDGATTALFVPVTVLRDTREGIWVAGLPETADIITLGQDYVTDGVPLRPSFEPASSAQDITQ
ncbi:Efflux pump periplasmic linker BepF [Aquimixticola soesokkakensis]|uniref:Efflux pump periplasmic linker BepF n=1 Tax=Aquimixticola soesokkakensis TaxID=1519096 RepID=A0A1Y5SP96_9RHOB|nr:efflux RND transporter periplasmic adaptor subunit [Aquimixticola soesokkakensis]SLN45274.1 Efflux pump periplasmic linker BepF [Aquimixticola soesokkakensis]